MISKRVWAWTSIVAVATTGLWAVERIDKDDPRVSALSSPDETARRKAVDELSKEGAKAVLRLASMMDGPQPDAAVNAWQALFRMVQQATEPPPRGEISAALVEELKAGYSVATRRKLCTLLGYVADGTSIDEMYKLLADETIREDIRQALVRIPVLNATQALVAGLQITEGDFRIALVRALGEKGDRRCVPTLVMLLEEPDAAMVEAAMAALARMPDRGAFTVLREAVKGGQNGAVPALLRLGATLADAGANELAHEAFLTIARRPGISADEFCQVADGLGRVGLVEDISVLETPLEEKQSWPGQWHRMNRAACDALAAMPGPAVTDAVAEAMITSAGRHKVERLQILGRRGSAMTDIAVARVVEALQDRELQVRQAAVEAMRDGGMVTAIPALLQVLGGQDEPLRLSAEEALAHMMSPTATKRLVSAMEGEWSADARAAALRVLGARGDDVAVPVAIKAATHENAAVRVAAIEALGRLHATAGLDAILTSLNRSEGAERAAAEKALSALTAEEVTARLAAVYPQAQPPAKAPLLRVLSQRKNPQLVEFLQAGATSDDVEVRMAAAAGLTRLDPVKYEDTLMSLAKQGPAQVTQVALDGYLAAAKQAEATDRSKATGMYANVLSLAIDPLHTLAALDGISRTAGPEDVDLLPAVLALMVEDQVPVEVCRAAARLAMFLPDARSDEALTLLKMAARTIPGDPMMPDVMDHLRRLGADFDPLHEAGFITTWWIAGAFPVSDEQKWNAAAMPTDTPPDIKSPLVIQGQAREWKQYTTADVNGLVDLAKTAGEGTNICAYAWVEFIVQDHCDAVLLMGSDDSAVAWLNGEPVHAVQASRPVKLDQDRVPVKLRTGRNTLLLKVINGGGVWGFCTRLITPEGVPLRFEQR